MRTGRATLLDDDADVHRRRGSRSAFRSTSASSRAASTSDGELVAQGDDPLWMQWLGSEEAHRYRLVYTTHRANGFWQRSTTTETAWEFTSARPAGDHEVLPLMAIDYDLPLSERATAPAKSPFSFGLRFGMPAGGPGGAAGAAHRRDLLGRRGELGAGRPARLPGRWRKDGQADLHGPRRQPHIRQGLAPRSPPRTQPAERSRRRCSTPTQSSRRAAAQSRASLSSRPSPRARSTAASRDDTPSFR